MPEEKVLKNKIEGEELEKARETIIREIEGRVGEKEKTPERPAEETKPEAVKTEAQFAPAPVAPVADFSSAGLKEERKQRQKKIEKIMEEGLAEIYVNLSPEKKREFRIKGEQAAREINNLLDQAKLQIKKIIDLIKRWLSVIPGVNKFFLEQESKIKVDEIIKLKN